MKKIMALVVLLLTTSIYKTYAQDDNENSRVITTAVPFLLIAADARAAGLGDQGVATSADAYAQQWNPSKYAFSKKQFGVGINYTPYLSNLVNDIFLGNLTGYYRMNERSSLSASLRYFSLGEIELRQNPNDSPLFEQPNELTFDVAYALRLSDRFSMAVTGRYLRSDLRISSTNTDVTAGSSFAVDVSGYYQSELIPYNSFDGRWRGGFNISNVGPKLSYSDGGREDFLPTNLRAGGGFDFGLDEYNTISTTLEFSKLLVPTPIEPSDSNNDGVISQAEQTQALDDYQDINEFGAIFSSFGDAPDGFSEELREFTWALGAEYMYQDIFAIRAGYFNESNDKGARKFLSLGAGFKYTTVNIDISYLFSTSRVRSPLEGTLRFGVSFNFGEDYDEY